MKEKRTSHQMFPFSEPQSLFPVSLARSPYEVYIESSDYGASVLVMVMVRFALPKP